MSTSEKGPYAGVLVEAIFAPECLFLALFLELLYERAVIWPTHPGLAPPVGLVTSGLAVLAYIRHLVLRKGFSVALTSRRLGLRVGLALLDLALFAYVFSPLVG